MTSHEPADLAVTPEQRADLEIQIRKELDAGQLELAATVALRGYGPEILGYLHAVMNDGSAADVFSMFCEDLWKGLPKFRGDSSFRTWAYTLARHAASRWRRDPNRRPGRLMRISDCREVDAIADHVRTTTVQHLRTEVKDEVRKIREQLEPDDRDLLVLRVDRRMSWKEIATITCEDAELDAAKEAARLRKRFERVKERLRTLVSEQRIS